MWVGPEWDGSNSRADGIHPDRNDVINAAESSPHRARESHASADGNLGALERPCKCTAIKKNNT